MNTFLHLSSLLRSLWNCCLLNDLFCYQYSVCETVAYSMTCFVISAVYVKLLPTQWPVLLSVQCLWNCCLLNDPFC